jgi:hypothetical protein
MLCFLADNLSQSGTSMINTSAMTNAYSVFFSLFSFAGFFAWWFIMQTKKYCDKE